VGTDPPYLSERRSQVSCIPRRAGVILIHPENTKKKRSGRGGTPKNPRQKEINVWPNKVGQASLAYKGNNRKSEKYYPAQLVEKKKKKNWFEARERKG